MVAVSAIQRALAGKTIPVGAVYHPKMLYRMPAYSRPALHRSIVRGGGRC